jgi:uncharacterized protein
MSDAPPTTTSTTWRLALAAYIREQAKPPEKFGHQPRLYALTQQIGHGLTYDDDIVYAAAFLHDLGVFTGHRPEDPAVLATWNHVPYTLNRTAAILESIGFPSSKIEAVLECILHHQAHDLPASLESTILRDADLLEQLGAIGIARTLCKIGRDTRFHTFTVAAAALQKALDTLPVRLKLSQSRILAEPRIQQHRAFLAALAAEAGPNLH